MSEGFPHLFEPLIHRGLTLKNRVVMAPMSTSLGGVDGSVTPANIAFYRERALGGFGLIIVEFTSVDPATGRTEEHQLSLDSRRNLDGHVRLVKALHDAGAKVFLQLQHGGRFAVANLLPSGIVKGPSVVTSRRDPSKVIVQALNDEEIVGLVNAFARTASLAVEAGYDGIEIHGAHGYLLSQFLSPFSNSRDDRWGGDAERRMAFPLAVVKAVRAAIGDLPLSFRLSAEEFLKGGVTIEDSLIIAPRLVEAGASILHVSTGRGPESFDKVMEPISAPEGWRLPYARRLREATGVPVIGVGQIRWPNTAEAALEAGDADLIALGRPSLTDPEWPNKAQGGRLGEIRPCTSCNWCISGAKPEVGCAENPRAGNETDAPIPADLGRGKRALVIGGGPGGAAAALMLDQAGFETHLFDSRDDIGGGLIASGAPPGKDKLLWYRDYLVSQLATRGVTQHLGDELTFERAMALKPDVVFIATGTRTRPFPIEGDNESMLIDAYDVLMGDLDLGVGAGSNVVVYGGGETGCEAAEYFAHAGASVVLVSRSAVGKLARSAEMVYRIGLTQRLAENPMIELLCESHIVRVDSGVVTVQDKDGEIRTIAADRVFMAQGRDPLDQLSTALIAAGVSCHVIGDSKKVGRIGDAVHSAYRAIKGMMAEQAKPVRMAC
jgi:2,4-dienoyl-CoA reductase-like NADH-dependent reductase (Old Yellow Enzyme family)/thioredoxin reductase